MFWNYVLSAYGFAFSALIILSIMIVRKNLVIKADLYQLEHDET